jgi:DNA-binding NtrC family response regulator
LPQDKIASTAMSYAGKGDTDFSERDILYQVLFDLNKDMNELKKLVFEMFKSGKVNEQIINDHKDLFQNIGAEFPATTYANSTKLLEQNNVKSTLPTTIEINKIEEVVQAHEVESLSIEDKEKELILKALKKNNQKRKYAAQDLGISERTLYRKIKQYDIEEN